MKETDGWPPWLLRVRRERPCCGRATENCYELATM
jgi:hypothetical protein